jgi:hypothetical protein
MADTTVSNTVAERRAGSSPALGTKHGPEIDAGDVELNVGKGLEKARKRQCPHGGGTVRTSIPRAFGGTARSA